jgi:hypothetical protein
MCRRCRKSCGAKPRRPRLAPDFYVIHRRPPLRYSRRAHCGTHDLHPERMALAARRGPLPRAAARTGDDAAGKQPSVSPSSDAGGNHLRAVRPRGAVVREGVPDSGAGGNGADSEGGSARHIQSIRRAPRFSGDPQPGRSGRTVRGRCLHHRTLGIPTGGWIKRGREPLTFLVAWAIWAVTGLRCFVSSVEPRGRANSVETRRKGLVSLRTIHLRGLPGRDSLSETHESIFRFQALRHSGRWQLDC